MVKGTHATETNIKVQEKDSGGQALTKDHGFEWTLLGFHGLPGRAASMRWQKYKYLYFPPSQFCLPSFLSAFRLLLRI